MKDVQTPPDPNDLNFAANNGMPQQGLYTLYYKTVFDQIEDELYIYFCTYTDHIV